MMLNNKKRVYMKYIKLLIVFAYALMICLPLQAQTNPHFAGEDKKVLKLPLNNQTVKIGMPDSDEEYCYEWSGPNIESDDIHQPEIIVKPQNILNTYYVTRYSSCGPEYDTVLVFLTDSISIVSVTPQKHCYNHGDSILVSDFEIETDPKGFGMLATVTPNRAINQWWGSVEQENLDVSINYANHTSSKDVTVDVYNNNIAWTGGGIVKSKKLKKFLARYKSIQTVCKKAAKVKKLVDKIGGIKHFSPCDVNLSALENIDLPKFNTSTHSCCEGEEDEGWRVQIPGWNPSVGLECRIPLAGAIPKGHGLHVNINLGVGLHIGPLEFNYKEKCANSLAFSLGVSLGFFLGLEVIVLDPDILDAKAGVNISSNTSVTFDTDNGIGWNGLKINLDFTVSVTMFSLIETDFSVPVGYWEPFQN